MPCLQHCSLMYQLSMNDDITHIARSCVFTGDARSVRMQFVIQSNSASNHVFDEVTLRNLRFGRVTNVIVDYVSRWRLASVNALNTTMRVLGRLEQVKIALLCVHVFVTELESLLDRPLSHNAPNESSTTRTRHLRRIIGRNAPTNVDRL